MRIIQNLINRIFNRKPQAPAQLLDSHRAGQPVRPLPKPLIERQAYSVKPFGSGYAITNGNTPGLLISDFERAQRHCDELNRNLRVSESEAV